ncbi:MAG: c-type cytochrome [Sulfuriferula sp.]
MKKIIISLSVLGLVLVAGGCNTTGSSRNLADHNVPGKVFAQQVCSMCHGADGNSNNPTFPKLAGQQSAYIISELKEFKSHDRSDPAGYQYMWGISRTLTDKQIKELAEYFSKQKNIPDKSDNAKLLAEGKDIFLHGIPDGHTPACATCHGEQGTGNGTFPRIAGQHADYIAKQLRVFKDTNQRPDGTLMKVITNGIPKSITPEQIKAVSTYLSTM